MLQRVLLPAIFLASFAVYAEEDVEEEEDTEFFDDEAFDEDFEEEFYPWLGQSHSQ